MSEFSPYTAPVKPEPQDVPPQSATGPDQGEPEGNVMGPVVLIEDDFVSGPTVTFADGRVVHYPVPDDDEWAEILAGIDDLPPIPPAGQA